MRHHYCGNPATTTYAPFGGAPLQPRCSRPRARCSGRSRLPTTGVRASGLRDGSWDGDSPAKCRTSIDHCNRTCLIQAILDVVTSWRLRTSSWACCWPSTTAPRSSSSPPSARWPTAWVPARSCWRSTGLPRQHGQAFGSYGAWKGLGYTLGPLLGGVLVTLGGFRCCSGCWPDWPWPRPAGQPPPCRPPHPCRAPGRPCSGWS